MSAHQLSAFNLEHLKKDAKRLLRACRAGDVDAIHSMQAALPGMRALDVSAIQQTIKLADVHQALALERGFSSWGDLTRHGDPLSRLLTVVRGGHIGTLRRDLADFAGLAVSHALAACALGDAAALKQHLAHDAGLAARPRDGWTPLDYVCSSPIARLSTRHATSLCDCAEILLAAGADPTTAVDDGRIPGSQMPAIVRAMLSGSMSLVVILKNHGAQEPAEALREWMESRNHGDEVKLQEVFREYFTRPDIRARFQETVEAFKASGGGHRPMPTDPRELQQLRMPNLIQADPHLWSALLDRGYDPASVGVTGRSPLHTLVTYAPASFVEMFLERGVNVDARDADGRSVLATAVRAGNLAAADVLRRRGVDDDSTPRDRLIGLCLAGDAEGAQALAADHPEVLDTVSRGDADEFVRAAARGSLDQVRLMLACGFPPDASGESGAAALHQAAWRGQVPVVELLLASGASPIARDELYGETALEWARHGASHAQGAEASCLEAAGLIEAAAARQKA